MATRFPPAPENATPPPEPLWREVLGRRLRSLRTVRRQTLSDTAERAGVSPQYLSEVERGLKEPSSEMIAAIVGALGATLIDLTLSVSDDLRQRELRRPLVLPTHARQRQTSIGEVGSLSSISAPDALVAPLENGPVLLAA